MKVLDLFCGAGGLSIGFKNAGFNVTGLDISESAKKTYQANEIGRFFIKDLSKEGIAGDFDIITGGPPCRPWSSVNTTRRGIRHKDYGLVSQYFKMIEEKKPKFFILENVPALSNTEVIKEYIEELSLKEYSIKSQIINYSEYGAPIARKRFILFGTNMSDASDFFDRLSHKKHKPKTVKDVIWSLKDKKKGEVINHIWPDFNTIDRYKNKYDTGKFGWYVLKWDRPSPSFGNIMKTYILYPEAFDGGQKRVISVKEALMIMGYPDNFYFPEDIGIGAKYQMVADSVSPTFSFIAAKIIRDMINYNKWF